MPFANPPFWFLPRGLLRYAHDFPNANVGLDDPPLTIFCSTVADPSRAPAGMHTIKVIGLQPYDLKEGPKHWDSIKDEVAEANLNICASSRRT